MGSPIHCNELLKKSHYSKGSSISSYSSLFQTFLYNQDQDTIKIHKHFFRFQSLCLDNQLKTFVAAQLLSEEDIRNRWQLTFDILYNLRFYYPHCQVHPFGSLLTGLGDYSSDVDLYIDVFGDDGEFFKQRSTGCRAEKKIHEDLKAIMRYSQCPHTGNKFACTVRALGTRVPFVRFLHSKSLIQFDLSFTNRISVQNSKLLLFYLNYDERIGPFLVFLRYWAKFHGISGEMEIKQYCLSLLALAYLTEKEIVPSVHLLQRLAGEQRKQQGISRNPDEFDGWDCSFCENRVEINKQFEPISEPTDSQDSWNAFLNISTGFFEMFAFLDLSSVVICGLAGKTVNKSAFVSLQNKEGKKEKDGEETELPEALIGRADALRGLEYNRPLCVQDPFVLNFNVGGIAKRDIVKRFQRACKVTYEKLNFGGEGVHSLLDLLIPFHDDDDDE